MKPIFFLILVSFSMTAVGQGYVIMNNSQKIKFNRINEESASVKIKEPGKKEKTEIRIGDMIGYFFDYEEQIYYPKEVTDSTSKKEYQFLRRIMSGKINLYEKAVESSAYIPTPQVHGVMRVWVTTIKTFIEKSGRLEQIMT